MLAFNEQKKDVAFEVPSLALTACDVLIVHDLLSLHVSRFCDISDKITNVTETKIKVSSFHLTNN